VEGDRKAEREGENEGGGTVLQKVGKREKGTEGSCAAPEIEV